MAVTTRFTMVQSGRKVINPRGTTRVDYEREFDRAPDHLVVSLVGFEAGTVGGVATYSLRVSDSSSKGFTVAWAEPGSAANAEIAYLAIA
jgi:hypothetical protein